MHRGKAISNFSEHLIVFSIWFDVFILYVDWILDWNVMYARLYFSKTLVIS